MFCRLLQDQDHQVEGEMQPKDGIMDPMNKSVSYPSATKCLPMSSNNDAVRWRIRGQGWDFIAGEKDKQ